MLTPIHCIALHTVKYNDRNNIVAVYSLEHGRMSFLVSAGSSREARRRRALMMPMSLLECVADIRPGRDIVNIDDVRQTMVFADLHSNPYKMAVAMFLAEFLGVVLRECQSDSHLFNYIIHSLKELDEADGGGTANFLPVFLYRLTHFLGIEPDTGTYHADAVFDMADGIFRQSVPLHGKYLDRQESAWLNIFSRVSWEAMPRLRLNRHGRRRAIAVAMEYYTLHFASLSNLNSLAVLEGLFD